MTGERPLRILHVDDEENQLEFTKLFLEQIDRDVKIKSVLTPEEALKLVEEDSFDCIISDYKMLSMNGIELAQKLREKSDVPFILYTGQGSEEVAEKAFNAGVDDYLRKEAEPTHYQVLAKRIRHTVEKYQAEELCRKVVKESRDGIFILIDNKVVFANNAAYLLYEFTNPGYFIGKGISDLIVETERDIHSNPCPKQSDPERLFEIDIKTHTGEIKSVEVSSSKISYLGKSAILFFLRDITQRKHLDKQLDARVVS